MVTTSRNYDDSRYLAAAGLGWDGVVRDKYGGFSGTGTLLFGGRAVLTAAHLFESAGTTASVYFDTVQGMRTQSGLSYTVNPGFDSSSNADLALVWLSAPATASADRYQLYRATDAIGQTFTMVGYGKLGTGLTGQAVESGTVRHMAQNRFDAYADTLKQVLGDTMDWSPSNSSQLLADFDNGSATNDALGQLMGRTGLGIGDGEGMLAQGDSGGPALIDGQIAGVATYTASLAFRSTHPDIDNLTNSSFGEVGGWQNIAVYQQWIDQTLRAHLPGAPTRPGEVKKEVSEGNSGTTLVYFLLQFSGVRSTPESIVGVDFYTVDGTAKAGSDYIAHSGHLNLYPDEDQAVIPVEILGDLVAEPDETFYLEVANPVGGSFGEGVSKLVAIRTIIDDDGWLT